MPQIELEHLKVHYQQSGSGPDVVLIHAFTSNLSVWMFTNIVEVLAADFRVTLYDLRGHGRSGVPKTGYTSADMAGDFERLHRALDLEPALVVGHSFGGVVAIHAARLYPDLVRGIVLSDTYFPGLAEIEPNMEHAQVWSDLRTSLAECGVDIGPTVDFTRLFHTIRGFDAEQIAVLKRDLGAPGTRWLTQLTQLADTTAGDEAFQPAGLTQPEICAVTQPVVALYDEHSPFHATCDFLKQNLANSKVDVVPGANHLALLQSSAEFVALVQKHLREMAGLKTATY